VDVRKTVALLSNPEHVSLSKRVLVLGGGIGGIETALNLASLGCACTLVEPGESLEARAEAMFSSHNAAKDYAGFFSTRKAALFRDFRINVLLKTRVVSVAGHIGDFRVRTDCAGKTSAQGFGAIVVATGFELDAALPDTEMPHRVISHLELEKRIRNFRQGMRSGRAGSVIPKDVCFIVADSGDDSAIRSASALKGALAVQKFWQSNVFVCCQNVGAPREEMEKLYGEARSSGVVFFKFDEERPAISIGDTVLEVTVRDSSAGPDGEWKGLIKIACDLLVVPERFVPRPDTACLRRLLRVNADASGFLQENNVWLKPGASNRKGIFFVGGCRGSLDVDDILVEARAVALEVYNLVRSDEVPLPIGIATVDAAKCALCLTCLRSCPHAAVEVDHNPETGGKAALVVGIACEACGICVAECPANAIQMGEGEHQQAATELVRLR